MLFYGRKLRWLCISADGSKGTVQADKRTLISKFELGIPIRDMRLLDSTLVTSSRGYIAVRENAIVFAIECAGLFPWPCALPSSAHERQAAFQKHLVCM